MPRPSCCRARASRTSSPQWTAARRTTASSRSRIRLAAASIATSTCCSRTNCRSSARSRCRWCITCWRCPGRTLADVKRIYSHPQALAQCDRFLRTLSGVEITATYDTAGSAKMIADTEDGGCGGHRVGTGRRGVRPGAGAFVHPGLRQQHDPLPRGRPRRRCRRRCPTRRRIVFTLSNEPGALFKALAAIALRGIDLTKLESRPIPGPQVGIPVLRGPGGRARRSGVRACPGPSRRVRVDGPGAGVVSKLEADDCRH